jgi:hypothetical protein
VLLLSGSGLTNCSENKGQSRMALGNSGVNIHGHGEIQMLDSNISIQGFCSNWRYPYSMQIKASRSFYVAQLLNNKNEFKIIDSNDSDIIICSYFEEKKYWFKKPYYILSSQEKIKYSFTIKKSGWMSAQIYSKESSFIVKLGKDFQILNDKWSLSLDRKSLTLIQLSSDDNLFSPEIYMGISYFLWVQYAILCEN